MGTTLSHLLRRRELPSTNEIVSAVHAVNPTAPPLRNEMSWGDSAPSAAVGFTNEIVKRVRVWESGGVGVWESGVQRE